MYCDIVIPSGMGFTRDFLNALSAKDGELVDLGVDMGIIDKSGSWLSFSGQRIGQGRENARQYFLEHPEVAQEIEKRIHAFSALASLPKAKNGHNPGAELEAPM